MTTKEPEFLTLKQLSAETGINATSLSIKICVGRKQGIDPPLRKRVGKCFLYDKASFMRWLWENADRLQRRYEKIGDADVDE